MCVVQARTHFLDNVSKSNFGSKYDLAIQIGDNLGALNLSHDTSRGRVCSINGQFCITPHPNLDTIRGEGF